MSAVLRLEELQIKSSLYVELVVFPYRSIESNRELLARAWL